MAERGGPTTQSGILYQNSWTALYLGHLCQSGPRLGVEEVVEVRTETVDHIDDIVVMFGDGHKEWIQAKEKLHRSSHAWNELWKQLAKQSIHDSFGSGHRLVLTTGMASSTVQSVSDAANRARSSKSIDEWRARLNQQMRAVVEDVRRQLEPEHSDDGFIYRLLSHLYVEIATLEQIERDYVRMWMPRSNKDKSTLFKLLRDKAGAMARSRDAIRQEQLLQELRQSHGIEIFGQEEHSIASLAQTIRQELEAWLDKPLSRVLVRQRGEEFSMLGSGQPRHSADSRSLENLLNEHRRVLILGEPGMGKTYLLHQVAHLILESESRKSGHNRETPAVVPVVLQGKLRKGETTLLDLILKRVRTAWPEATQTYVVQCLRAGMFGILIDGLDEVGEDQAGFIDELERLATYDLPYFLLTSRTSSYRGELADLFDAWRLEPLKPVQISEYLRNTTQVAKASLPGAIYGSALFRYPLYLMMARQILVAEPDAFLPNNRAVLQELFARKLIEQWAKRRNRDQARSHLGIGKQMGLLARLAAAFYGYISLVETEQYVAEVPGASLVDEYDILAQSGIVIGELGECEFSHQSFQEYFLARYLSELPQQERRSWLKHSHESQELEEVVLMLTGLMRARREQAHLLDFLQENNFALFVKALSRRFQLDTQEPDGDTQVNKQTYVEQLGATFRSLYNLHFRALRNALRPYRYLPQDVDPDSTYLAVKGELDFRNGFVRYTFLFFPLGTPIAGVLVDTPPNSEGPSLLVNGKKTRGYISKWASGGALDLNWERLGIDSAREVATKDVLGEVAGLLKAHDLYEPPVIVAQRLHSIFREVSSRLRMWGSEHHLANLPLTLRNADYLEIFQPLLSSPMLNTGNAMTLTSSGERRPILVDSRASEVCRLLGRVHATRFWRGIVRHATF
jgi:hypothetical protein